ncbi:mycothiol synthase [Streptosporangium album]|uniref:Mycothiol acetyltransferase n=1 Tax=Streptosporangium album TaxID=47479 RepID=A0A7W7RXA2_9ACTN|nr:mycothiol synthase [Streptosporangium album]MBB4939293.1 mycothiol synthase [Streptosporangium album]MBB4944236.1 mycothiol synthase [Streptosporangium album]
MNAHVEHRGRLDEREVAAVLAVVEAATEADGVRPLNEHVMLHLRYGGDDRAGAVLLYVGDDLAGYAHVDPTDPVEGPSGELVVHPAFRGQGHGRHLLQAVLEQTGGRLRLWAHGGHPGAEALALSTGFTKIRSLWQMRRSLFAAIPAFELPEGVRLRAFVPGSSDEEAWVALNAKAFAHHPEQGAWTLDDLKRREQEPWFDPAGFFLAERPGGSGDGGGDTEAESGGDGTAGGGTADGDGTAGGGRLVGFHWTKVHGDGGHGHEPIGEVYVVGVDPAEQGGGLGRSLTLAGLSHLRSRGLAQVMLYVDESNPAAIHLYEKLGFTRWDVDVMYRR